MNYSPSYYTSENIVEPKITGLPETPQSSRPASRNENLDLPGSSAPIQPLPLDTEIAINKEQEEWGSQAGSQHGSDDESPNTNMSELVKIGLEAYKEYKAKKATKFIIRNSSS